MNGGFNRALGAAALLLASFHAARADDDGRRAFQSDAPVAAPVDETPLGAIAPKAPAARLDLPVPDGLTPALPPEAPAPDLPTPALAAPAAVEPTPTPADSAPAAEPTPAVAHDPVADAIKTALDAFVAQNPKAPPVAAGHWTPARKAIADVYAARGFAPLWLDGDHWSARAGAALERLARAGDDGLDLARTPTPGADWRGATPQDKAAADLALSAAVVSYALQASGARIDPASLSKDVSAKPELPDPAAALTKVAAAEDPEAALLAFNPPQPGYRALRARLVELRGGAGTAGAEKLDAGPTLQLGMTDPRVPLIRARFGVGARKDAAPDVYDVRVASAVAAFQRVHGLPPSGALTEATAKALDGRALGARQEAQILANMEMWRWQPRDMGAVRVEVNVPDFTLRLMNGEEVAWRARVIVGKPDTPTPIFSNSIRYMLFNPIWRVPESIVKKEMAPHAENDPSYYRRHGYKVTYVGDRMEVEQPPGEANALGRMLFLFPNEHAVYLHDTPLKSLFSSGYRALSHGCVRVEGPQRLAELLMGGAAHGWTDARVHSLIGDKERTLSLPNPVPIHIQYFTEVAEDNGVVGERPDIYGLTEKVAARLTQLRRD